MKPLLYYLYFITLISLSSCKQSTQTNSATPGNVATTSFYIYSIPETPINYPQIQQSLTKLKGVTQVKLDSLQNKATVYYHPAIIGLEHIAMAVTTLDKGHTYKVYNMTE